MKFFQGIQIVDKEKNIDCELLNLGRINILCGKNNAGKTTLLKTIEAKKTIAKTTLNDKEVSEFKNEADKFTLANLTDKFTSIENVNQFLENYIIYKEAIFSDLKKLSENTTVEGKVFSYSAKQLISHFIELDDIIYPQDNKKRTLSTLIQILNPNPNIKYVEAKRRINVENSSHLNLSHDEKENKYLEKDMIEVIKYLYQCQNARKVSQEFSYYNTIKQGFKKISKGYSFDIVLDRDTTYLEFAYKDKPSISAEDMGLGLRDVLTILIYAVFPDYDIVLIEEPENHLHPEMQRELLRFLSQQTDKQFFISTHSNIFLDMSYVDKIYTVFYDDKINVRESTDKADALSELGYLSSDNLLSDVIILTEGKTDIPVLEEFLRKYNLFEEYDIKFLAIGGISVLESTKYESLYGNYNKIIIVTDGDNNKQSKKSVNKIRKMAANNDKIIHCELKGYGIENYLNAEIVKTYYDENSQYVLADGFEECLNDDKNLFQLEKKVEGFRKDERVYRIIASRMIKEDIEKVSDILSSFIDKVREVCESLPKKK
ncbi:ATP-dependent endonuclease [Bernardetia sp. OM2101]|uniref:AAA family ATPase n=1 Tax=Bernardetia sp. OM2101 TaxID=3344876 RepID=UPI0035CF4A22